MKPGTNKLVIATALIFAVFLSGCTNSGKRFSPVPKSTASAQSSPSPSAQKTVETKPPSHTVIKHPDWKTWNDSENGFSIQYPSKISPVKSFETFELLPDSWRSEIATSDSKGKKLLSIPIFKIKDNKAYPKYFTAEIRIGNSAHPQDVADCLKNGENTTEINNKTFTVYPIYQYKPGHFLRGVSFRILHKNTCWAIEQLATGAAVKEKVSPSDIPDNKLESYYNQENDIIETFQLLD